jgi:hypothetical protein
MIFGSEHAGSFRGAARAILTAVVSLGFVACGGDNNGGDSGSTANARITDAANYKVVSTLDIPSFKVKAGADLRVCWPDLNTDLLKHTISATADITHVSWGQIKGLTEADIEQQFAVGTFDDRKLSIYRDFIIPTDKPTCANLTQFKLGASVLDPAVDFKPMAGYTYMLMWAEGLDPGVGVKTMCFLEPDDTSNVEEVTAPQGKDILTFVADLTTPQKVDIPAAGPWVIDWSGLTKDAFGQEVVYANLDSIFLAHYDMTVADLEARALDFELIADAQYRAKIPVGTKQIDLATAKKDDGTAFSGFTSTSGFWGVAIMCSKCQIPAPVSVSVLNPI